MHACAVAQILSDLSCSRTADRDFRCFYPCEIISIHHECEVGVE